MKQLIILSILFTLVLSSCDYVNIPLEAPIPAPIDTSTIDTSVTNIGVDANGYPLIDTAAVNISTQKVFVEEFTGHSCTGCPAQSDKLLNLQADNGHEIIVATYHEGIFAKVELPDYPTEMRTTFGGDLHSFVEQDIDAYPSAMVNRTVFANFGNKYVFQAHNQWEGPIVERVNQANPTISMGVGAILNNDQTFMKIRVSLKTEVNLSDEHLLLVLCIEDSVIAEQKDGRLDDSVYPHKINTEYVHRHVVRSLVNTTPGLYGETVVPASGISADEWINWELNYGIPDNVVNAEHVIIVAAVFNVTTSEVVQVEEVHAKHID